MDEKEILNTSRIGTTLNLSIKQGTTTKEVMESVLLIMHSLCTNPDFEVNADTAEKIDSVFDSIKNTYKAEQLTKSRNMKKD